MSTVLPPPPPDPLELLLAGAPPAAPLLLLELLLLPHAANNSNEPTIRHTLIAFARTLIKSRPPHGRPGCQCPRLRESSRALGSQQLKIVVSRPRVAPLNRK